MPSFLLSSCGRDAAFHDLQLYKDLLRYKAIDMVLAESALAKLNRYLWYLAPQTAVFALFSDKVSEDHKSRMASRLLTLARPETTTLGIPKFPVVCAQTELWELLTEESWTFFDVVKSDPLPWLTKGVAEWESFDDYNKIKFYSFYSKGCQQIIIIIIIMKVLFSQ